MFIRTHFNRISLVAAIAVLLAFASCSGIEADFSYSPEAPKAGATVTFTNKSSEGEKWSWSFGDGGTSTSKNPTKIYKKPGTYEVTLTVDGKDRNRIVKQITVYDTIPHIEADVDSVSYYESFTLSAVVYNPYNYDVTYKWSFSENAFSDSITNQTATSEKVTLFFNKSSVTETVTLILTVGTEVDTIANTYYVHDVPTRSLLMAREDGNLLRQRIYDNGLEEFQMLNMPKSWQVKTPSYIVANNGTLYVFDADTVPGTAIQTVNMDAYNAISSLITMQTGGEHAGFWGGCLSGGYLYWTDENDFVYRIKQTVSNQSFTWLGDTETQTTSPYYLVLANRLGYFGNGLELGQQSGGFAVYDDTYFWGKQGTGRGIFRFTAADIQTAIATGSILPEAGVILTDYAIQSFDIDRITKKIYFVASAPSGKTGLWISNLNGQYPVLIDADATGALVVDNQSDYLYYAKANAVMRIRLVKSSNNVVVKSSEVFTNQVAALALTIDNVLR